MNPAATEDVPHATPPLGAGEVLRPAFTLWLWILGLWGAWWLTYTYAEARNAPVGVLLVGYAAVLVLTTAISFVYAWADRTACRVFARPRPSTVELCLLVGIAGSLVLLAWETGIPGNSRAFEWERGNGWPLGLALVAFAVLPAVGEELAFRGVIQQRLVAVVSPRLANALQAMMFAALHMDAVRVLPLFAWGCLAGFLRHVAGALWPCILMHFVWNGWLVLEAYDVL